MRKEAKSWLDYALGSISAGDEVHIPQSSKTQQKEFKSVITEELRNIREFVPEMKNISIYSRFADGRHWVVIAKHGNDLKTAYLKDASGHVEKVKLEKEYGNEA